jgi:hypothetical protein
MTGPQDPAAAGGDRLRAGHADRDQVIEALKDAFVQDRLTRDELGALTADIPAASAAPPAPAAARTGRPPAPARRRPLVRAATGSGISLVVAAAARRVTVILDPSPHDTRPGPHLAGLSFHRQGVKFGADAESRPALSRTAAACRGQQERPLTGPAPPRR